MKKLVTIILFLPLAAIAQKKDSCIDVQYYIGLYRKIEIADSLQKEQPLNDKRFRAFINAHKKFQVVTKKLISKELKFCK